MTKQPEEKLSAQEKVELFEKNMADGNMAAIAAMMGPYEYQDYLQNGSHWRGKWDIDLYADALRKQANSPDKK